MHPRAVAQRSSAAHGRMLEAVKLIASNTETEAPDLASIRDKDADVRRVKEIEALADWLEGIAAATAKGPEADESDTPASATKAKKKGTDDAKT